MSQKKKSFFYNPLFRVSVYMLAWMFLRCFKILTLLNHRWNSVVEKYEKGNFYSTAAIGFTSSLMIEIVFIIISYKSIKWSLSNGLMLLLLFLGSGVMGILSLIKYQDYENEKYSEKR